MVWTIRINGLDRDDLRTRRLDADSISSGIKGLVISEAPSTVPQPRANYLNVAALGTYAYKGHTAFQQNTS